MSDINEKLCQLINDAIRLPPKSRQKYQKINEIYLLVNESGQLWREHKLYYEDALQEMWGYCCQNLHEYDSTQTQVITWFNRHLKNALARYRHNEEIRNKKIYPLINKPLSHRDIEPSLDLWEETAKWVKNDPDQVLRSIHFPDHPEITAQVIILRRLPPDIPAWKEIAQEFNLNDAESKNLAKWYSRSCLPLLRKFGNEQGYI
jgi:hypothetical protein